MLGEKGVVFPQTLQFLERLLLSQTPVFREVKGLTSYGNARGRARARLQRLEPALAEQLSAALRELRPAASANLAEVLDRIL